MFNKGLLFKVIFGGLVSLTAAIGVIYMYAIKPYAPTNLNVTIDTIGGSCEPVITFRDNSRNEDDFRVYRWNPPNTGFILTQIFPLSPGKGTQLTYTDSALAPGTYTYTVSAYNEFGESESDNKTVIVSSPNCAIILPIDPSTLLVNPIIVSLSIINDCSVRISYRDNSTNEQGFRIYRRDSSFSLIKTLGPHAGIPGTYDDNTKLSPGTYGYRIVAYNQYGDSGSNFSQIEVTSLCTPAMQFKPTQAPYVVLPTLQKNSTEACTWQAAANVFLRKGPDIALFDRLADVQAGQGFPIVGQSEDGQFWAVEVGPGVIGYITKSEKYSRTNGDCSSVPTLKDPAPPVIEAPPTKKPHDNSDKNNETPVPAPATPCPVGAVCP